jgi:hypothetical protein
MHSASGSHTNYLQNLINEIKKFNRNSCLLVNQLNNTNNACKELKVLQQSSLSGKK